MSRCGDVIMSSTFRAALLIFLDGLAIMGIVKSIGIYVEEIMEELGTTSTDIGISLGLLLALHNIPAPLATFIYRKKRLRRPLLICASVMLSFGLMSASFVCQKAWLPVCTSISGFGGCILLVCGTINMKDQSSPHFNLVWGLSMTGFGVGMAVLPLMAEFLRQAYGWRGGLLILGGLVANIIPCAASLDVARPSEPRESRTDGRGSSKTWDSVSRRPDEDEDAGSVTSLSRQSSYNHNGEQQYSDSDSDLQMPQVENDPLVASDKCDSDGEKSKPSRRVVNFLRNLTQNVHIDPVVTAMSIAMLFLGYLSSGWHNFIVPHAIQRKLSTQNILLITMCASIGSLCGRVSASILANNLFNPVSIFITYTFINIGSVLCDVLLVNTYVMMVTTFVSAYMVAGRLLLAPMAVIERAPVGKKDIAVGRYFFLLGIGMVFGGYISGAIADHSSSYDVTFQVIVGAEIILFLMVMVSMVIDKFSTNKCE